LSSRQKKFSLLSGKFGEMRGNAFNGFLVGAAVGSMMGALIGAMAAVQTRRLIYLPVSIITSGGFFGFMMMCGSIVRADSMEEYFIQQSFQQKMYWRIKHQE
ncbi:hypothetical protein IMG5_003600, partial [Ichthyophthirius multifiliis]